MITSVHIENFKCFKDFDIELGPFNVLIGPNDAGKTAFLQAILVSSAFKVSGEMTPEDIVKAVGVGLGVETPHGGISSAEPAITISHAPPGSSAKETRLVVRSTPAAQKWVLYFDGDRPHQVLQGVRLCQFDPARLREPAELSQPLQGSGFGLPAFLARLALNYKEARDSLQNAFRRRFPFYTDYKTVPGKENGRDVLRLEFSTVQQRSLPSESVSDGVMVSLGFLALAHDPEPPAILLVEEPENGVHHASLKDIVQTLRDLTATGRVQVILTTHSPYLLDYAQPNEVHVFTKDEQGAVHARKLADFEGTDEIGDMFGTGEKWTMLSEKHGI